MVLDGEGEFGLKEGFESGRESEQEYDDPQDIVDIGENFQENIDEDQYEQTTLQPNSDSMCFISIKHPKPRIYSHSLIQNGDKLNRNWYTRT